MAHFIPMHHNDVIMTTIASKIISLTTVYSTVYSDADQRKHQSSASLAFVWGIHRDRWIPRIKGQLRGKCFHFDDVIMGILFTCSPWLCFIVVRYWLLYHYCGVTLSLDFLLMGTHLSLKAALLLAERVATLSDRCSNTGTRTIFA